MGERLARGAYSWLLRLLVPAYLLRLWSRGRAEPLYRRAVGERLGLYGEDGGASSQAGVAVGGQGAAHAADVGWTWVHAVSLGETRAAGALIDALRAERPGLRLLLTNGTATGREAGAALLRDGDRQVWLPFDTPGAVRRFFSHFRPAVGVLMETEIWPNLLHAAHKAGVPMVLASARLSARSLAKGRRVEVLLRPAAQRFARVLAQTEADATRLQEAGAPTVEVIGNLKYDLTPDAVLLARGAAWRAGLARPVVLAAATREGEEAALLAAWQRLRPPGALLLIVPRHPQRFDEVASLVRGRGLTLARRSAWAVAGSTTGAGPNAAASSPDTPPSDVGGADVWLGDSLGEMALYYAIADVALLGGSFAAFGGQNLIEAAACACPLLIGPSSFNFAEAAQRSIAAGASLRVADLDAALREAAALLQAPARRAAMAAAGLAFTAGHRGAARRMAARIAPLLPA